MAYSLVAHRGQGLGGTGGTTTAIDTTGADLIVLSVAYGGSPTISVSDSKGNTWTQAADGTNGGCGSRIYYAKSPTVGSGHTFTVTGGDGSNHGFEAVCAGAFSGADTVSPLDQTSASNSTATPGSVTPSQNNELVATGISFYATGTVTINGGFTISDQVNYAAALYLGCGLGYLVQTTAAAANPTWAGFSFAGVATSMATFKAAAVASGGWIRGRPTRQVRNTSLVRR